MDESKELFLKAYQDVQRINDIDPVSSDLRYAKTLEEVGELFKVYNKFLGRKVTTATKEELRKELLEESSDVIQCIYSLTNTRIINEGLHKFEVPKIFESINIQDDEDNSLVDWMDELNDCIGYLRSLDLSETYVALAIDVVLIVANQHHISINDIHNCILNHKNPKWEQSISEKRFQHDK